MRQEPTDTSGNTSGKKFTTERPRWVIIGYGRLGRTFSSLLQLRGDNPIILRSADAHRIVEATANADRVLLCVPDSKIKEILDLRSGGAEWIHFSATVQDSRAHRAHPMRSFDGSILSEHEFAQIPFALEKNSLALPELLPGFRNPSFALSVDEFQKYHALCVLGASFPVLLWSILENEMQKLGIKAEHLRGYAEAVGYNYGLSGAKALTGPWVRHDTETTERNQQALQDHPDLLDQIYTLGLRLFKNHEELAVAQEERSFDALP